MVVRPQYEVDSVLFNLWQNDDICRVNPIMKWKNYGYVIAGQYTAYVGIDEFTHSALESMNVRLTSNVIKKKIFDVCLSLLFEPNNSTLYLKFYSEMEKFLNYMKNNGGLYDYKIVMNEESVTFTDINTLRCPGKIYASITRTAEYFDIDFVITGAGAVFETAGVE